MDTKINIVKILKDWPIGTKLYSPLFGEVIFDGIEEAWDCDNQEIKNIVVITETTDSESFSEYGVYFNFSCYDNSECMLFPSKENRDWSVYNQENIIKRIKTFEDACAELGNDHQAVIDYYALCDATSTKDILTYAKLRIITAALNQGWKPNFDKGEYQYYPWFCIYSKNEYDDLSEEEKGECRTIRHSDNSSNIGVAYIYSDYTVADNSGSYLALKTRELAEYCGRQFIDIWGDYLFS